MKLFNKPLVVEFTSWCFSFRCSYGEEAGPAPAQRPAMGFRMASDEESEDEEETEEEMKRRRK